MGLLNVLGLRQTKPFLEPKKAGDTPGPFAVNLLHTVGKDQVLQRAKEEMSRERAGRSSELASHPEQGALIRATIVVTAYPEGNDAWRFEGVVSVLGKTRKEAEATMRRDRVGGLTSAAAGDHLSYVDDWVPPTKRIPLEDQVVAGDTPEHYAQLAELPLTDSTSGFSAKDSLLALNRLAMFDVLKTMQLMSSHSTLHELKDEVFNQAKTFPRILVAWVAISIHGSTKEDSYRKLKDLMDKLKLALPQQQDVFSFLGKKLPEA